MYSNITEEMSRLRLTPSPQQQVSPGGVRKVAPSVPPKPKKAPGLYDHCDPNDQALYSNIPTCPPGAPSPIPVSASVSRAGGVQGYYAVNAPAPGTVGVASAMKNLAYNPEADQRPLSPEVQIPVPGRTQVAKTTDAHELYSNKSHFDVNPPTYIPPPPQPAHSYTPTSRLGVHMGAAQPLYSNTGSQPIYKNTPVIGRVGVGYNPSTGEDNETPPPLPTQPPPTYSNCSQPPATNGATSPFTLHYANVLEANRGGSSYSSYGVDNEFPPPPPPPPDTNILPSPPSPVSSSYSELRRATPQQQQQQQHQQQHHYQHQQHHQVPQQQQHHHQQQGYVAYAPGSHMSSTYESLYEPITPRSVSQMSNKSDYGGSGGGSVYGPYTSPRARGLVPAPSSQPIMNPDKVGKEAEVDALTNLLVQSMDSSGDPEFFGICARCGDKVVGEGSGCTAMEQVFHIKCFMCDICELQLQGKPFYALESKPYCETCYLNTLEKCCVCTKPILDRILRATGKPYHPGCFTCVVCHKSLDGIPFTVDASNLIHCIDDFHKKFAPRCSVCKEPIMPEAGKDETVRVVALDRSFHVNCYKCEDCGLLLSSEAEGRGCYPLDGHVFCKSCNARRVQAITSTQI